MWVYLRGVTWHQQQHFPQHMHHCRFSPFLETWTEKSHMEKKETADVWWRRQRYQVTKTVWDMLSGCACLHRSPADHAVWDVEQNWLKRVSSGVRNPRFNIYTSSWWYLHSQRWQGQKARGHYKSLVSSLRPQRQTVQPITPDRVRIASRMTHQCACRG